MLFLWTEKIEVAADTGSSFVKYLVFVWFYFFCIDFQITVAVNTLGTIRVGSWELVEQLFKDLEWRVICSLSKYYLI